MMEDFFFGDTCVSRVCGLVEGPDAVRGVRGALFPDDVAVVVDDGGFFAFHKTIEELEKSPRLREELNERARLATHRREDLGHEVGRDLFRRRGEDREGELAELGGGVLEEEVGEDHARRERVHQDLALGVLGRPGVALRLALELGHQRVGELRQAALADAVRGVARGAAAADARAHSVVDVAFHALLRHHELHGHLCAD
mmetsp:Transcript_15201/g.51087  ORF Transcript_15201/g.51087 Transcript_15201/m.51087 type:complete len:200 (-) Transcript_15201:537-1136(-)